MRKEIMAFGDNNIEKSKFHCYKNSILLVDVNIDNLSLIRFLLVRKSVNTLLVTWMMIITLNHLVEFFQKQVHM